MALELPVHVCRLHRRARKALDIRICMDGKGGWRDNVFVERLWETIRYEEVYLHAYATVSEAKAGSARYVEFYNTRLRIVRLTVNRPMPCTSQSLPLAAAA